MTLLTTQDHYIYIIRFHIFTEDFISLLSQIEFMISVSVSTAACSILCPPSIHTTYYYLRASQLITSETVLSSPPEKGNNNGKAYDLYNQNFYLYNMLLTRFVDIRCSTTNKR